jgi:hypothetical protein
MADRTAIHARMRLGGGGARAGGGGRRRVAGDDQNKAPGHEIVREEHLRIAGDKAILTTCSHGWNGQQPRRGVHGGGRPATGERRRALRSGSSEKEGGDRVLTLGRSSGGRGLDGEGGGGGVQHRRPVFTGGDGELRLERTGACRFDRMQGLARTCEGEVNGRVQGASPAADEHGRRQWHGGRRFKAVAQAARARESRGLGVKRRGRCGVL